MNSSLTLRFCIMMFLQFFIWGVWYVPMWKYLANIEGAGDWILWGFLTPVGLAYASTGIAAMVSPFIVGMIADRFFPTQVMVGVLHLLGAVFLYLTSQATHFNDFFLWLLLHLICYMPTLALVNSLLFQNVKDPQRDAPPVRTLGTIGWIASGILIGGGFIVSEELVWQIPEFMGGDPAPTGEGVLDLGSTTWPYVFGVIASVALGLFAFSLPHTPPHLKGKKVSIGDVLGLKAIRLMKDRSFAVFIICSLLICIPLSFYFQSTNFFLGYCEIDNSEGVMTLGQVSEIFFLLLVPFFFRKYGVRMILSIGMLFWVLRYILFANAGPDAQALAFLGVLFHGICYDFFFFAGQLYIDKRAPDDIRSAAQGFIAFVTLGIGMFIGGLLNGWWVLKQKLEDGSTDWSSVWYFPAIMAGVVLFLFLLTFRDSKNTTQKSTA
ncbi:MAG: MFS transporter [Opitutales bacterium]